MLARFRLAAIAAALISTGTNSGHSVWMYTGRAVNFEFLNAMLGFVGKHKFDVNAIERKAFGQFVTSYT
jgi:hypothetical protein